MDIQDRLIELFVHRDDAVANGDRTQADLLQVEIDDLKRQRDDIRIWAGGAAK